MAFTINGSLTQGSTLSDAEMFELINVMLDSLRKMHGTDEHMIHDLKSEDIIILRDQSNHFNIRFAAKTVPIHPLENHSYDNAHFVIDSLLENLRIDRQDVRDALIDANNQIASAKENDQPLDSAFYNRIQEKIQKLSRYSPLTSREIEDIPMADPNRPYIILKIYNHWDGVGDYHHGIEFAKSLKKLVNGKGYKVIGLIETVSLKDKPQSAETQRAKYVKQALYQDEQYFDEHYLCEYTSLDNLIETGDAFREAAPLKDRIAKSCFALTVSYKGPYYNYEKLPKDTQTMVAESYGTSYSGTAGMSLPRDPEEVTLKAGIKLEKSDNNLETKARDLFRLKRLTGMCDLFVANLLGSDDIPRAAAVEKYLNDRHFMPGYIQNKLATNLFIVSHILKHTQNNTLDKPCDFVVPAGKIDRASLLRLLKEVGYNEKDICFINGDNQAELEANTTHAKIRIYDIRIPDDERYKTLYSISDDGAGCSGDNSISLVFSSKHLPYYQYKWGGILGSFYHQELMFVVQREIDLVTDDPELVIGLKSLQAYFNQLNIENYMPADGLSPQKEKEWLQERHNASLEFSRRVGELAKGPHIQKGWEHLRSVLFARYNYNDHFKDLVSAELNRFAETMAATATLKPEKRAAEVTFTTKTTESGQKPPLTDVSNENNASVKKPRTS